MSSPSIARSLGWGRIQQVAGGAAQAVMERLNERQRLAEENRKKVEAINEQTKKIYSDIENARVAELEGAVQQAGSKAKGYVTTRTLLASAMSGEEEQDQQDALPQPASRRRTLLGSLV